MTSRQAGHQAARHLALATRHTRAAVRYLNLRMVGNAAECNRLAVAQYDQGFRQVQAGKEAKLAAKGPGWELSVLGVIRPVRPR